MNPLQKFKQSRKNSLNTELIQSCARNYGVQNMAYWISTGADVLLKTPEGKTLLDLAATSSTIGFLLSNGVTASSQEHLNNAARLCIYDQEPLTKLLSMGADVDYAAVDSKPLIFSVTDVKGRDILALLLENGAAVNIQEAQGGDTPLHQAVRDRCLSSARTLLQYGASSDIKNNEDETAVELARRLYKETNEHYYQKILDIFHAGEENSTTTIIADAEKISFISEEPSIGQRITETFNFKSGQYREVIYCEKTNSQSSSMTVFEQLEGSRLLLNAEKEFIKQGGKPASFFKNRLDKS